MTTGTAKTFFIIGVSTGLGCAFAVGALTAKQTCTKSGER